MENTEKFRKLCLVKRRKMAIEQLVEYYAEYRIYCFEKGDKLKGIELRKKIYPLVKFILKLDQILSLEKNIVIKDKRDKNAKGPHIFACTHIGGNDIQRSFQIINIPAYLMLGDPGILYKMPIYQGLKMNGVIPLETKNRKDRKIAYSRAIELLNKKGNLLIYPEGAWNVTPNQVVMKIFTGTVRIAMETGADIIPIGVEQYDKTFYFNIGENYRIDKKPSMTVEELTSELRDKLATLKWEIMEQQPTLSRKKIPNNYLQKFQSEIVERCNYGYGFSLEDAISESFHDKTISSEEDVFAFLENIDFNLDNAYLAKQRILIKNK